MTKPSTPSVNSQSSMRRPSSESCSTPHLDLLFSDCLNHTRGARALQGCQKNLKDPRIIIMIVFITKIQLKLNKCKKRNRKSKKNHQFFFFMVFKFYPFLAKYLCMNGTWLWFLGPSSSFDTWYLQRPHIAGLGI